MQILLYFSLTLKDLPTLNLSSNSILVLRDFASFASWCINSSNFLCDEVNSFLENFLCVEFASFAGCKLCLSSSYITLKLDYLSIYLRGGLLGYCSWRLLGNGGSGGLGRIFGDLGEILLLLVLLLCLFLVSGSHRLLQVLLGLQVRLCLQLLLGQLVLLCLVGGHDLSFLGLLIDSLLVDFAYSSDLGQLVGLLGFSRGELSLGHHLSLLLSFSGIELSLGSCLLGFLGIFGLFVSLSYGCCPLVGGFSDLCLLAGGRR